jgi:hypothetical protein
MSIVDVNGQETAMLTIKNGFAMELTATDISKVRMMCIHPEAEQLLLGIAGSASPPEAIEGALRQTAPLLEELMRTWEERLSRQNASSDIAPGEGDGPAKMLRLFAALKFVEDDQTDAIEREGLVYTLCLRDRAANADTVITLEDGALVLKPGSITIEFIAARVVFSVAQWAVVIGVKKVAPGLLDRALGNRSDVLKEVRRRALQDAEEKVKEFHELDAMPCSVLVVLVHGLFSTDAGFFDGAIREMRRHGAFKDAVFVGFPHNPMLRISENSHVLAGLLEKRLLKHASYVLFLTHHRGGLVARSCAARLNASDPVFWGKWLAGCASFGTPHLGVPYADSPARVLGTSVLVCRPRRYAKPQWPAGFMRKRDLLGLLNAMEGVPPSLTELLPPMRSTTHAGATRFLDALFEDEERLAAVHVDCRLNVVAVGGNAPTEFPQSWVTGDLFMTGPHDVLVAQASAAPKQDGWRQVESAAEHRTYFEDSRCVKDAVEQLSVWLHHRTTKYSSASLFAIPRPPFKFHLKP